MEDSTPLSVSVFLQDIHSQSQHWPTEHRWIPLNRTTGSLYYPALANKEKPLACLLPKAWFYQIQAQNSLPPKLDTQIGEGLSTREVRSEFSIHEDHSGIFSWLLIKYLSGEAGKLSLSSLMQLTAVFQWSWSDTYFLSEVLRLS